MKAPRTLAGIIIDVLKSGKMRRISAIGRLTDHLRLKNHKDHKIRELYGKLLDILDESHEKWDSYDYGEGYFYQSYPDLNISGLRKSDLRLKDYNKNSIFTKDKSVLDIGCNAGFLSLMMAKMTKQVDAFELNPYLIRIAEICKEFEGVDNVRFQCSDFDTFDVQPPYDIVLSLANHHTFDGNMRPDFKGYMERIRGLMADGGILVFESHPGEHSNPYLKQQLGACSDLFGMVDEKVANHISSVFDSNRLIVWMKAV